MELRKGGRIISQHRSFRFDGFLLDPEAWKLYRDGQEIHLEPRVLQLLVHLVMHRDRLVTREELMDTVWDDTVISEAALSKAVGRLRQALGDDPGAARFVETVHSRGYRFIAEVEEPGSAQTRVTQRAKPGPDRRRLIGALALILLAVLSVRFWPKDPSADAPGTGPIDSLAVLPLENLTGDPEQEYFVEGLHEMLITEISRVSDLRVTSRQSTIRYRSSQQPLTAIAAELGVDALVEGSILQVGERVRLTTQLIDGRSDSHLWADAHERDAREVFSLLTEVAATISGQARVSQEQPRTQLPELTPVDPAASQAYLRGLYELNRFGPGSFRAAVDHFQAAVDVAPDFALGWGYLAAAHLMLAYYGDAPPRDAVQQGRVAALRALELDDGYFIGHAALGWVRLFTWDWPGACEAFSVALELNPSDPMSLHGEADCLMLTGQQEESLARLRRAQLVDPFTPISNMPVAFHLYLFRRYDEAIAEARRLGERLPGYSVHWLLALVYWQQGRFDESLAEERLELERHQDLALLAALGSGREAGAPMQAMGAVAEALVARSRITWVDPFRIAVTFARAGRNDAALEWLGRAIDRGSLELTYIGQRPEFDALRDDPRFSQLLQRMGLPGT